LAICSERLAALPGCQDPLTASEKLRRRGPLTLVRRWHSLRQFLVGKAAPWLRSTPELRTDADYPSKLCLSLRTISELLLSHPCMKCDIQPRKINEISCKNRRWWAREDSNLQPSGYEPLALTIELRARVARALPILYDLAHHGRAVAAVTKLNRLPLSYPRRLNKNTACSPNRFQNHHGIFSRMRRPQALSATASSIFAPDTRQSWRKSLMLQK
jgi:hypothetical protein